MRKVRLRKFTAELIGTMVLVITGCGTAMLVGTSFDQGCGYILTALAFGLAVTAMAYSIGNISGCHINPAVSLGMLLSGKIGIADFVDYIIAQCIGAFVGSGILAFIFHGGKVIDRTNYTYGANMLTEVNNSAAVGLLVEILLTFIFVLAVLGITSKKNQSTLNNGIVIGISLTLVHILGIGLTGTSVNPARSIGPALMSALTGTTTPLSCLWVFIVGPLIGAALAAAAYRFLESGKEQ